MSRWGDLPSEMRGAGIDEGTMDRLLRGRILPDDAPPGFSDVASILVAAASPPGREELRMQAQHVIAAHEAIRRRARHPRPGTLGLATGLVVVGALLLLPGLAAANVLPNPAQHAVTTVLEKVGITIPASSDHPAPPASPSAEHPASTGAEISSIATTTDATGVAKGAEISSVASGGKSQAGQHGQASAVHAPSTDHGASSDPGAHGRQIAQDARASHGAGAAHAPVTPGAAQGHP